MRPKTTKGGELPDPSSCLQQQRDATLSLREKKTKSNKRTKARFCCLLFHTRTPHPPQHAATARKVPATLKVRNPTKIFVQFLHRASLLGERDLTDSLGFPFQDNLASPRSFFSPVRNGPIARNGKYFSFPLFVVFRSTFSAPPSLFFQSNQTCGAG